ncbi:MAG: hypothetical protein IPI38_19760 [Gemmatimonadetes bacterium]|nr:hypothetical protein [Gemmatimonadota bacterium]MBK7717607.1 hypothetical protein [Gemmatimonadota bacterium]MBK9693534.1 hypothetical protein [Gemmatimonadota bacterium]
MRILPFVLAAAAVALAACSDGAQPVNESGSTVTWQPHPGVDTSTTPGFPSAVTIQGSVYQAGTGVPTDTGAVSTALPVPGVTVRIMHNVLRNGQAAQDEMARVTSDANGAWAVSGLPGGYYVVEGLTPAGTVAAYELVATHTAVTRTAIWMPVR